MRFSCFSKYVVVKKRRPDQQQLFIYKIFCMKIYNYFFYKLYSTFIQFGDTPEHSALLLLSHSIVFNLFSILNFLGFALKMEDKYYWIIGITLTVLTLIVNYSIFLKNDKFKSFSFKNSLYLNSLLALYLFGSFFFFFYSLYFFLY